MSRFILQGGGGHARVVIDALLSAGHEVDGFFADRESIIPGIAFLGTLPDEQWLRRSFLVVAIGDNGSRLKIVNQLSGAVFANVIHPSVLLGRNTVMGNGCMLLHRCIVQPGTAIGEHVILNTACQVDHDGVIDSYVHVGPGAVLCGEVKVGEGALIGAGSVVLPGRKIGRWATVGAGSVVVEDVPDHSVVMGNPAKKRTG